MLRLHNTVVQSSRSGIGAKRIHPFLQQFITLSRRKVTGLSVLASLWNRYCAILYCAVLLQMRFRVLYFGRSARTCVKYSVPCLSCSHSEKSWQLEAGNTINQSKLFFFRRRWGIISMYQIKCFKELLPILCYPCASVIFSFARMASYSKRFSWFLWCSYGWFFTNKCVADERKNRTSP